MSDYKVSVSITGDATSFQRAFTVANNAVDNFNAKTNSIAGRVKDMGQSLSNVGGKITKFVTTPAMGAVTALNSLTLVKGFNRLRSIDDAKAKLKGLGHEAQTVKNIMKSALESVKGTSYGLDEAATTAASAVAAGIKPGRELTRYLSLTADAAAEAGASMGDMGSIINKVQTSQRAYTENLNQLADRGLPIYQWLAKEANTTADQIRGMAKDGQISSEMFLNAIEKNIGGAAKIIGENSFNATLKNIGASLGRIGANFLDAGGKGGGFFSQVKPLLPELNGEMTLLEDKGTELGKKFGAVFSNGVTKIRDIKTKFDALDPAMQTTITKSAGVGTAFVAGFGPGITAVGKLLEVTGTLTGGIDKAVSGIKGSTGKISGAFGSLKTSGAGLIKDFKNLGGGLIQPIEPLVTKISGTMKNGLCDLGSVIAQPFKNGFSYAKKGLNNLIGNFGMKFPELTGIIGAFESNSKGMFSRINGSIGGILQKVSGFAPCFLKGFGIAAGVGIIIAGLGLLQKNFGDSIDGMINNAIEKGPQLITTFCDGIVSKLPVLISQGGTLITKLMNAVTANLPAVLSGGVNILCALVDGVSKTLPNLIPAALDMVLTLVNGIITNLPQLVESGLNLIVALVKGLIAAIPNLIQKVPLIIGNLVAGIGKMLPKIVSTGITLITQLAFGLIMAIPQLLEAIPKIIANIKGGFAEFNWGEIGKNIIDGIKDGLSGVASKLVDEAKRVGGKMLDGIKERLGIHSPSRVFRDEVGKMAGIAVGIGFIKSIPVKAMQNSVAGAVKKIAPCATLPSVNMISTGTMVSANRMIEDVSLGYGKTIAQNNVTNYQSVDVSGLGDYIVTASIGQMQAIAEALEKGIAGIKLISEKREIGRMMCDMGFVRT